MVQNYAQYVIVIFYLPESKSPWTLFQVVCYLSGSWPRVTWCERVCKLKEDLVPESASSNSHLWESGAELLGVSKIIGILCQLYPGGLTV
jgi:hypothetical protein